MTDSKLLFALRINGMGELITFVTIFFILSIVNILPPPPLSNVFVCFPTKRKCIQELGSSYTTQDLEPVWPTKFGHSISITHHSSLITYHSSLITQFFTSVCLHHSVFITHYFSHYLEGPRLS